MKKCNKCDTDKPLADFYKKREAKDGHDHLCKKCRTDENEKRRKNKDKWLEMYI